MAKKIFRKLATLKALLLSSVIVLSGVGGYYFYVGQEGELMMTAEVEDSTNFPVDTQDVVSLDAGEIVTTATPSRQFSTDIVVPLQLNLHVNIHTDYPVKIDQVLVERGDLVSEGQPIALLDAKFLAKQLRETKSEVATLQSRRKSLTQSTATFTAMIDAYSELSDESEKVLNGTIEVSKASGVSAQNLLDVRQQWQQNKIATSQAQLELANSMSELTQVNESLRLAVDKLDFYEQRINEPFVISEVNASVYKIYIQEGGDLIEYVPLFTLAKPNFEQFRVSLPTAILDNAKLQGIELVRTGEDLDFKSELGKGAFGQSVAFAKLPELPLDDSVNVSLRLHWESSEPVVRLKSKAVEDDNHIWRIDTLNDKSTLQKLPVEIFYREGSEHVLLKIKNVDIDEGLKVVLGPNSRLSESKSVTIEG